LNKQEKIPELQGLSRTCGNPTNSANSFKITADALRHTNIAPLIKCILVQTNAKTVNKTNKTNRN